MWGLYGDHKFLEVGEMKYTIPETNISHPRVVGKVGKMSFLFHWWDMDSFPGG